MDQKTVTGRDPVTGRDRVTNSTSSNGAVFSEKDFDDALQKTRIRWGIQTTRQASEVPSSRSNESTVTRGSEEGAISGERDARSPASAGASAPAKQEKKYILAGNGKGKWEVYVVVTENSSSKHGNIELSAPGAGGESRNMTYTQDMYNSELVVKKDTSVWVKRGKNGESSWLETSVKDIDSDGKVYLVDGSLSFAMDTFEKELQLRENITLSEPEEEKSVEGRSTKSSDNEANKLNSKKSESQKAGKSSKSSNASEEKVKSVTVQESGPVSCSAACGIVVAVIGCIIGVFVCICLKKANSSARTSSGSGFAGYSTTGENANGNDRSALLKDLDDNSLESAWGEDY